MNLRKPKVVVFSGPSGSGKTTLINSLQRLTQGQSCVSTTTRSPRPGEINGVDYHFLSEVEFARHQENGGFLEQMRFNGYYYGTKRVDLEFALSSGQDVYMNMSCAGARAIRRSFSSVITVFILPPSYKEVWQRLRDRGMSELEIEARFTDDDSPISCAVEYDLLVVNHTNKQDDTVRLLYEFLENSKN